MTLEECKERLLNKNITDERIKEIRDYLYAISTEIVLNNLSEYEQGVRENNKKLYNKKV